MSAPQEENSGHDPGQGQATAPAAQDPVHTIEGDIATVGNLDKIRNILFGAQARDYERRFARLEERLSKEASDIREDLRRRFDALEAHMKRELESLDDRLRAEESERAASVRDVGNQLKETSRSLQDRIRGEQAERSDLLKEMASELHNTASGIDRRIGQLGEQTSKAQRELRDAIADLGRSQSEELRGKTEELWAALSRSVHELRSEKTDRAALSAMLSELAMRLSDEFKFPADE